ncbi:response regulator [Candidatus Kuenenbacteria bacterium CG11_big_fil_rev_8_21_14_0_20_37_9]|uniref:Response regulator n=1 Tax=Candidatus Kuenenbacteria bacterium CG08_land_8_20_14_0_20_37_23 TaxID=1974617 RepID=A0A2M6XSN0_9BACT|nr:MAG: response regulator [Candidatus Kuenenbacteria bacterium CG11_big_fil_rev_8_21_14_0_20_37_9]PIU10646.1 MAG: response regulator [Candidatus Kuenenbacteria bacterium CG08_land_8_20_14_0_20_37_23]
MALDGEEGLRKARESKPDLIILDLILPKLDGFNVLREIKKDNAIKHIPVIVLTNLSDVTDKAIELGADKCLVKSDYSMSDIMEKIKSQFK